MCSPKKDRKQTEIREGRKNERKTEDINRLSSLYLGFK
jgi:hypothetical protein